MGCCCAKKDKDGPLLQKGSLDYGAYLSTDKNKTQYVTIDDDDKIDILPNLTTIDGFNKNVKNRSRQSSSTSQNNSLVNSINNSLTDIDWKPSILKTYKIEYKSLTDLNNKELLVLLELYLEYYTNNNEYKLNNKNGYESFLSLHNWYEKDNKKGGQQEKLKRIKQFSTDNNIWQLPIDITNFFNEYYVNKNISTNKNKYYISKIKQIISMNNELLYNIKLLEINGIKMYYKIYYPNNKLNYNRIPLLLISEYGQCKEDWLLLPKLLSLDRIIITFDMRGIGQTDISYSSSLQNNYSIDLLASDIAGLIEKLSYLSSKIFILGNGILGGIIAQTLCIRFQHLIHGLILCNTLIPNNNQPKNIYIQKYNQIYSQFKTTLNNLNKQNKNKNDCIHVGCVESITLINNSNENNNCDEKKEEGEMDINKMDYDFYYPFNDSNEENKYKIYSFIMECNINNSNNILPFGPFNTINGNIPYSLLNRPINGIIAQQNGFIKLLSTKTNVISSRINEIKQPTMILSGNKNIIIPSECTQYLGSRLVNCEIKEINVLDDIGHLWWISSVNKCVNILNKFIFKIERNLLIRYDIIINNIIINNTQTNNGINNEQFQKIIITSKSFITDEKQQLKQMYEIMLNNNNINEINNMCFKFLCVMNDLGKQKFEIKIINNDKVIGIGECVLTEAYNVNTIININEYYNINIKHGWNKYEYQKRLNENENDMITPNGYNNTPYGDGSDNDNNQRQRLDTDDLDGLDL